MGYYQVGKFQVFEVNSNFTELQKPFIDKLSPLENVGRHVVGDKVGKALWSFTEEALKTELEKLGKDAFIKKWVVFTFEGTEAQEVAWDLIYGYFRTKKIGRIEDIRDPGDQIRDDYAGKNFRFPHGEAVLLSFVFEHEKKWFSKRIENSYVRKYFDFKGVAKIHGSWLKFTIYTKTEQLTFHEYGIDIYPIWQR